MLSSSLIPLRAIQEFRPAKYLVESHYHPFYHLIYVTNGSALVSCGNIWSDLKTGDMIIISSYQTHMIYTVNGVSSMDLKFSCAGSLEELDKILLSRPFWVWHDAAPASSLIKTIIEEARAGQEQSIEIISAHIYLILMHMMRALTASESGLLIQDSDDLSEPCNNEVLNNALEYIDTHLLDDISVASIAKYMGYSTSYFSTLFKKEFHIPPQQYIMLKKVDVAKKLIRQNQLSISAISDMLHFCSIQAFTNTFKKYCGISPKQYYKRNSSCTYINLVDSPMLPPNNSREVELIYCQDLPNIYLNEDI